MFGRGVIGDRLVPALLRFALSTPAPAWRSPRHHWDGSQAVRDRCSQPRRAAPFAACPWHSRACLVWTALWLFLGLVARAPPHSESAARPDTAGSLRFRVRRWPAPL